jgi:hypothetical protein
VRGLLQTIRHSRLFACTALLLAVAYFLSQTEMFGDEYEAAHPAPSFSPTISPFSITWETFDKDNATPAFVINVDLRVRCLLVLESAQSPACVVPPGFHPVRDKSPPLS